MDRYEITRIASNEVGARRGDEGAMVMRKGPWMAEEDEILIDYVRKYGPRDWSAIRSKGLLPRTGKSCRLRWVNKLKPDLKIGCKFSPEEERIVIDLQAQFGNKWARIATYLPGRTDNDVKNFWSTRQKRLARLLRTPLPPRSSQSVNNNAASRQLTSIQGNTGQELIPFGDESSNWESRQNTHMDFSHDFRQMVLMPPPAHNQNFLNVDMKLPLMEQETETKSSLSSNTPPQDMPFCSLPPSPLDFPGLLLDGHDLNHGLGDMCFQNDGLLPSEGLLIYGYSGCGQHGIKREEGNSSELDNFFDDLPGDMFDYLDPLPEG